MFLIKMNILLVNVDTSVKLNLLKNHNFLQWFQSPDHLRQTWTIYLNSLNFIIEIKS
jgi:hypothetical protein